MKRLTINANDGDENAECHDDAEEPDDLVDGLGGAALLRRRLPLHVWKRFREGDRIRGVLRDDKELGHLLLHLRLVRALRERGFCVLDVLENDVLNGKIRILKSIYQKARSFYSCGKNVFIDAAV